MQKYMEPHTTHSTLTNFHMHCHSKPLLLPAGQARYNTVVSYHINTDEAYWNFTIPGRDGQHNPECLPAIIDNTPPPNST